MGRTGLVFYGEMPEWSIGAVSKTVERASVPRVRIPVSPPFFHSGGYARSDIFLWATLPILPFQHEPMEPHMTKSPPGNSRGDSFSIAALEHPDGTKIDRTILKIVRRLRRQGYRLAGAVRAQITPADENRCDLFLEDLSTSTVLPISQDLGSGSHACRLDDVALDAIAARVEVSLQEGADILILNKFGKQEAEGRGLRSPIVNAVNRGTPVLVGLNPGRAKAWNEFCGATGEIFDPDDTAVDRWLEANLPPEPRP